jgi:hydroxypyruvate reductase
MCTPREHLLLIYNNALKAVNGLETVAHYLRQYQVATPLALIAIGKAATQMARGAFAVLGSQITPALLITKFGYLDKGLLADYPIVGLEAAHPVPDASSLAAGEALLRFIKQLPSNYPVLFLISGGTSALVEVLTPGVTLADLQRTNRWLLASGLDIEAMNQVRKSLSAIKGGRLASYLQNRSVLNLLISDVPRDDLSIIGSGLLTPSTGGEIAVALPSWLHALTMRASPLADRSCFATIQQRLVATPALARQAAKAMAQQLGYTVYSYEDLLIGEAQAVGRMLGRQLGIGKAGIYLWSSETTVQLPENPGRGGRCQSLALALACEWEGQTGRFFLAAGTDGNDGTDDVAGAVVDGNTIARGKQQGFDFQQSLLRADAGSFLAASGDLIYTGATGTNVMDLLIGLKVDESLELLSLETNGLINSGN